MPTNDEIFSFMGIYGTIFVIIVALIYWGLYIYRDIKNRKLGNMSIFIIFTILLNTLSNVIPKIYTGFLLELLIIILILSFASYEIVYFVKFVLKKRKKK